MKTAKKPLIIITGPTAAGKTGLSIKVAQQFGGEIISADSRQVYCGLNIGTGKITDTEMAGIPHHCIDIQEPQSQQGSMSAVAWSQYARTAITTIESHSTIPIVCGGTGFYIDTLLCRTSMHNVPPTPLSFIQEQEKRTPNEILHDIHNLNPERASNLDPHNIRRLIRALFVEQTLSKVKPEHTNQQQVRGYQIDPQDYNIIWIGVCPPLTQLRSLISERLIQRYNNGMLAETQQLLDSQKLTPERCKELGLEYAYMAQIITEKAQGTPREKELLTELETKIWQYAKRQLTWHKKNTDIVWFDPKNTRQILNHIKSKLGARN